MSIYDTTFLCKIESKLPQVILVDGNGYLHPRQFGFACHLGVILDVPTIGVGKNFLVIEDGDEMTMNFVKNRWKTETLPQNKDRQPLIGKSKTLYGYAVKSNDTTTNPIFVSVGHKIDIETAITIVLKTCIKRGKIIMKYLYYIGVINIMSIIVFIFIINYIFIYFILFIIYSSRTYSSSGFTVKKVCSRDTRISKREGN